MVQYPNCPFCGNSSTALSIVDVEIDNILLKGVKCNNPECGKYMGFFKDEEEKLKKISDSVEELENRIDELI